MKKFAILSLIAAGALLLAACGGAESAASSVETSPAPAASSVASSASDSASETKTIQPLPETLSVDQLSDCTVSASFSASDVVLNDDGALTIHMTVYDYELFDLVDISQLAVGDTLVINGKDMVVSSRKEDSYGITINGGLENGGCYLVAEDNVWRESGPNGVKSYFAIGEVTLPVDQDFVFTDDSDLEHPGRTSLAGDFLEEIPQSDKIFTQYNTTVEVAGGKITAVHQIFVP